MMSREKVTRSQARLTGLMAQNCHFGIEDLNDMECICGQAALLAELQKIADEKHIFSAGFLRMIHQARKWLAVKSEPGVRT